MLHWSGLGIALILVVVACFIVTQLVVNAATGDPQYYQTHGWPKLAACWVSAAVSWPLGRYLNRGTFHITRNPETGRKEFIHVPGKHSVFFIPVQYCWIPLVVLGVVLIFV
jgi:hypothetical protein